MKLFGAALVVCQIIYVAGSEISTDSFELSCHKTYSTTFERAAAKVSILKKQADDGKVVPNFGDVADNICNDAVKEFCKLAPAPGDNAAKEDIFDQKVAQLESALDVPLQVVYCRQLANLRDKAIQRFTQATKTSTNNDFEAMQTVDTQFTREAEASTRKRGDWGFAVEKRQLQSTLREMAERNKKLTDATLKISSQNENVMGYLQSQQDQITKLKMEFGDGGGVGPWNLGIAYKIPDSNINIASSYTMGRRHVQICFMEDPTQIEDGADMHMEPGCLGINLNFPIQ
uniref:Uncharacterized protein n=1 Tax=Fibrocapsa japonica TaxID=94617 RepID=A0A7S2UYI3_9STRA|mmetsp:Transcript_20339/g.29428  ORF Transcript_20339/g.29428 Transcript_20339/m.29428 type:complete len:287 (+) Transcript_20339:120-980(+)